MSILPFARRPQAPARADALVAAASRASIEVMPRSLAGIENLEGLLPLGTRVYVAHIHGTPISDMVAAAARLSRAGYTAMPHIPARIVADRATLADWLARYRGDADVSEALLLAGGVSEQRGAFHSSIQLLETGLFDRAGFTRLHVAGHPEGNRDIDPAGGDDAVMQALHWKQAFAARTDATMAIVTQFVFEAQPVLAWARRLAAEGIDLPVHVGLAGPAKLQTLIRFAIACGVGPSLRVLQRRAADVTKLVRPFAPTDLAAEIVSETEAGRGGAIAGLHLFPLGGIGPAAAWLADARRPAALAARPLHR